MYDVAGTNWSESHCWLVNLQNGFDDRLLRQVHQYTGPAVKHEAGTNFKIGI